MRFYMQQHTTLLRHRSTRPLDVHLHAQPGEPPQLWSPAYTSHFIGHEIVCILLCRRARG